MASTLPLVQQPAACVCGGGPKAAARKCALNNNRSNGRLNVRCSQSTHMVEEQGRDGARRLGADRRVNALEAASRTVLNTALAASFSLALCFGGGVEVAQARPEGVNKPELLPKQFTPVIDMAGFLTGGQEERIAAEVNQIEEDTGFKLRVLAQNYPNTPGLAIRDFWKVDDNTIVFVADPSLGNILNFNVGSTVDLSVPRSFWSRLAGKYGNIFYWREKGEDASIEAAVSAIGACLREPPGAFACSEIQ